MRVAMVTFIGALFLLVASILGVGSQVAGSAGPSVVVILGDPAVSTEPAPPPTDGVESSPRPTTVETIEPDIEHYSDMGDYYEDGGGHAGEDLGNEPESDDDLEDLDDLDEVDDDLDDDDDVDDDDDERDDDGEGDDGEGDDGGEEDGEEEDDEEDEDDEEAEDDGKPNSGKRSRARSPASGVHD